MPMETVRIRFWKASTNIDSETYWDHPHCRECDTYMPRGNEIHICKVWINLHWPGCYCHNQWANPADAANINIEPVVVRCYKHVWMFLPFQQWEDYEELRHQVIGPQ